MIKEYIGFIKRYLRLSKPKKIYFYLNMLFSFLCYLSYILFPFYASLIIEYLTKEDITKTYLMIINLAVVFFGYRFFWFLSNKIYAKNMNYTYQNMMRKILNKISKDVDDNFDKKISKGKLINSVNSDVIDIGDGLDQISWFVMCLISVVILCIIVAFYNIWISLIMFIYIIIYIKLRNNYNKYEIFYYNKQVKAVDRYTGLYDNMLSGKEEIKTFNMMPKLTEKIELIKKYYSKNYMKKRKYATLKNNDIRFVTHLFLIILYLICLCMMKNGLVGIEFLVLITGYMRSLVGYGDDIISFSSSIREIDVAVKRIDSLLNYKPSDQLLFGNLNKDAINGKIIFNNISFSYDNKKILDNFNLVINPNELTLIVGQSGCGKSTIVNLLLRLYKLDKGEILIDNTNINEFSKKIYKSNVSIVNQKPFLFKMSIRENFNFVDKNINNHIKVCKRVGIHDFIMNLPKGYNTVLRENASNISGGQKQLISIARTLLSNSEILIFDEITSSLDPESTREILKVIKNLKKDHTIIMISHKPSIMKHADRIIVMNKGKIVGDGTHSELIKNNEDYKWLQARKSASKLGEEYETIL